MDVVQILTVIGVAIANIGTTITLFCWATNRAAEDRNADKEATSKLLQAIHAEMKDFHGRLCEIESRKRDKAGA